MKKEIDKAVETFHIIALGSKKIGNKFLTESKLSSFITVLTELLMAKYQNNWYPGNPTRGSAFRCVRVNNQSIDPTILEGLKRAGIRVSKGLIRTELTIWVDPGVVSVRIGEEGSIGSEIVDEEVYRLGLSPSKRTIEKPDEIDEAYSSRSPSPAKPQLRQSPKPVSPPSFGPQARLSPHMEYNPYAPPAHVSYPRRFLHATPPPSQGKKVVPKFSSASMPVTPATATNSTAISQGVVQSGHIPSSYSRPRALFPQENHGSFNQGHIRDGLIVSESYAAHSMSRLAGNMMPINYLDIPAMA